MNEKPPALTQLQSFQHRLSYLLDNAYEELDERECQAFLTYTVQRATIVLAPSTSKRKAG